MKLLIKNGTVVDPAGKMSGEYDVLVEGGKISSVSRSIVEKADRVIDAKGLIVCPGFIDMHVHLREPGREDKETILTASRAAARGGICTIVGMPNTTPNADNQTVVHYVTSKAKEEAIVNVYPVGSITKQSKGKELAEIGDLKRAGAIAVSDDGEPIMDMDVYRKALQYLRMWKLPLISHSEDKDLSRGKVMHEGLVSTELGLAGIPALAESIAVAREIALAEDTGTPIHFTHISTKQSLDYIRDAKRRKIKVTCDTCPHYFILTDEAVRGYNPLARVNPPLRSKEHLDAVIKALKDDVVDVITTDHAPHLLVEKYHEFDNCATGIVGLETSVGLVMTYLVRKKMLTVEQMVLKMSTNPAAILGLASKGSLAPGNDADITIIDPEKKETVDATEFESKARNTPFNGYEMTGVPAYTIVSGRVIMKGRKVLVS
ncbi:dihydroorotase [Candidatus Woesearchaeota archaeon]|nr:dihydroorotase [Candidatus Woesearchaeota archaeon]